MKLPLSWLQEYIAIDEPVDAIATRLVRLGHEVEGVETPRADFSAVRVGHIVTMEPHPGADRLQLLTVDVGAAAPLNIVCGARNMKAGDKVPVATVGATLPDGMVIKQGKIRGEVSCGMCCSEKELGLADDAEGLLILPEDAPVGSTMGDYLQLETAIFDLSITPNRGDCMSVYGLARELAADLDLPLNALPAPEVSVIQSVADPMVDLQATTTCPCYMACCIDGVTVTDAPAWLQAKLRAAGQRPINGVVDTLNLLMLEIGQPMHAFDAAKLNGDIAVRQAVDGETMTALDGHGYTLQREDLVVADSRGVQALAGIIGAESSAVGSDTTRIILESAFFQAAGISRSRRRLGIVSEASMRFERGVDPLLVAWAITRAAAMIGDMFGGKVGGLVTHGSVQPIAAGRSLSLSIAAMEARLGMAVDAAQDAVLQRMGFALVRDGDDLGVTVPSFRHDVTIAEDLSEEYARIIGYDAIPFAMPQQVATPLLQRDDAIKQAVQGGLVQVINYAFISSSEQRLFTEDDGADVVLSNPISTAMAVMRRSLLPGLLRSAQYNLNRQQAGVALVEQGRGYAKADDGFDESNLMGWLLAGELAQAEWFATARLAEFRDIKGAVEQWLQQRGVSARFVANDTIQGLQPGQSAQILVGRDCAGVIGRVQPAIAATFQIDTPVFVAQLATDLLNKGKRKAVRFAPLPEFPAIIRDVVMLYPTSTTAADILQVVQRAGGKLMASCRLFDRFDGEGVAEDKVSLGVRCCLCDPKHTLTQEDADRVMAVVVAQLSKRFEAVQR
ncbi:MAG: phenylalanine--tRNA ligase subunit beta [Mariprofundales bacterium]